MLLLPMTVGLVSLVACWQVVEANDRATEKPNIVVILSDDMGFSDLGCYGGEIRTPHLDQLAEDGLRFTQFYNTARCCPTRASLLTGVYQHQAGIGLMTGDKKLPGYRGELGRDVVTIAEALKRGGYQNYMSGKWHVTRFTSPKGPKDNWPRQRGFDRFYGTIVGAGSFFDPATLCRENTFITPENDTEYQPEQFYYTDAISDNAVQFLKGHDTQQPFFLYVAYTTAHWPMHALPEDIERYDGVYDAGFDAVRQQRYQRLLELGLIDASTQLSPVAERWDRVKNRDWEIRNMEVYAAMVDRMDQGIGRILQEIERQGTLDNTLIFYLQDNGGCAEGYGRGKARQPYRTDYQPLGKDGLQTQIWPPMQTRDGRPVKVGTDALAGPEDSFVGYGRGWANVSNTPFREYKHFTHEGGISTPLIAYWPRGIAASLKGSLVREPGHVMDILATCLEASGVDYPSQYGGQELQPLEGTSLTPAFSGKSLAREAPLCFEHHLNCAIRDGRWKLVRKGSTRKPARLESWELYDMQQDRSEIENLADRHPDQVQRLSEAWEAWANRARVKPWPWELEGE